jgi:hypothetical protein
MNCSIGKIEREINANGVEYDRGSVFERFGQLTDIRKARGKRFSLETVLYCPRAQIEVLRKGEEKIW